MATNTTSSEAVMNEALAKLTDAARVFKETAAELAQISQQAAKSTLEEKTKQVDEALQTGVRQSTALIKRYPIESALVCFGVGCLLGTLLRPRD